MLEQELDFEALEQNTRYEGYTAESQTVKDFWDIVHSWPAVRRLCAGVWLQLVALSLTRVVALVAG